jgi:transposase
LPPPTDEEIAEILGQIHHGVTRLLRRAGRLAEDSSPTDPVAEQMPLLAGYAAASIQERIATGPRAGHPVRRLRTAAAVRDGAKLRCARLEGFSLHANVAVPAHAREERRQHQRPPPSLPAAGPRPRNASPQPCTLEPCWSPVGTAVLLPPHAVRPYVLRNKTDRTDAKGLLEAFRNEDVHPVPVKSETQQALAALHRLRSTWLATRTARINTIRGLLREFGLLIPVGAHHVIPKVRLLLEDADSGIPGLLRPALAAAAHEIPELDARIRAVEQQLEAAAAQALSVRQLRTIPGIGLLTATALVAAVGDVQRFPSARHFASYLGLTPRENSTGPRQRLGAISKRGDTYLRMRLIHGARSVLCRAKTRTAPPADWLRTWALQVERRRGHNKAAVALANKLARIAWGVWRHGTDYVETPAV